MHGEDSRNLRLSFEHRGGRDYLITAALGDGAPVSSPFALPISDEQLVEVLATLGETRSLTETVTATATAAPDDVTRAATVVPQRRATAEDFGTKLADALFAGEVGALFEQARAEGDVQLRIVLTEDQTDLLKIPWEFLCRKGIFIAAQPQTPVLRELWTDDVRRVVPETPTKIRILAVSASPAGLEILDTAREHERIGAVVADHPDVAELEWIDGCTFDQLHAALDGNPHVLHFVGHSFCDDNGDAGLILTRDDGSAHQVSALAFANLIGRAESLQLVVLNSCEGFRAVDGHPYASLAAKLVRVGRSAVIAMQFKITDGAAIRFSEELYKRIVVDRFGVDRAMSEARMAVMGVNEMEFATPVLYLRDGNAELFRSAALASGSPVVARAVRVSAASGQVARLGDRLLQLVTPPLIGDDVAELQERLHAVGIDCGPVDGLYGERTAGALEAFQERADLPVDGICGPQTIAAFERFVSAETPAPPDDPPPPSVVAPPAPAPMRPVAPIVPDASSPTLPSKRSSGTRRGVLIGVGVSLAAIVGLGVFLGDDPGDSGASGTTIASIPSQATAATVPPGAAPVTGPPAVSIDDLFGVDMNFPAINGPTYVVDPEDVAEEGITDGCDAIPFAREFGVVVAESETTVAYLTLQATSKLTANTAVALVGVTVEVDSWLPPAEGVSVWCPGLPATDGPPPILVSAVLPSTENGRPTIEYRTSDGVNESDPTPAFPRQLLLPGETIFFDLAVDSTACDCEWIVALDMVVDGESERIEITDQDGLPFNTTGSGNATPLANGSS